MGELTVTLTSGTVINLGNVKGTDGNGITRSEINSEGHLLLTFTDGTVSDLGNVVGAKGSNGSDGVGISEVKVLTDGTLTITLSNGETKSLGNIKGEKGEPGEKGADGAKGDKGDTGRGIAKTEIIDGYLWVTYTDNSKENVGSVGNAEDNSELIFVELSDGTYGVKAGGKAKDKATITIPETYNGKAVTVICDSGFMNMPYLTTITIPDSVVNIDNYAFYNCLKLNNIVLPANLTTIGEYAFSGCLSLNAITIPANVTTIKKFAFWNDNNLSSATFENTNGWYTDYSKSSKSDNAIYLFAYTGVSYKSYEQFIQFTDKKMIAKMLSRSFEYSYLGPDREYCYQTLERYSYDWHRE